jgi:arsenate reductase
MKKGNLQADGSFHQSDGLSRAPHGSGRDSAPFVSDAAAEPYCQTDGETGLCGNRPKVAFVCVHNSCRSQIAEALGKHFANHVFESYSAGTETKPGINQDAVRLMKRLYGIDMERTQHSKLLERLPDVDMVVTMGCNVECPLLPCKHREDWGLNDPTGKDDAAFARTIAEIFCKIEDLQKRIQGGQLFL